MKRKIRFARIVHLLLVCSCICFLYWITNYSNNNYFPNIFLIIIYIMGTVDITLGLICAKLDVWYLLQDTDFDTYDGIYK